MTDEDTAAEALQEGKLAFKLGEDTPVYKSPDAKGEVLAVLPAGSLITVEERSGDYLHVVTPADGFGYMLGSAPVDPIQPAVEVPSRSYVQEPLAQPSIADDVASGQAQPFVSRLNDRDRDFTPAHPLQPGERLLIYDRIGTNKRETVFLIIGMVAFLALLFAAMGAFLAAYSGSSDSDLLRNSLTIGAIAAVIGLVVAFFMYLGSTAIILGITGGHQVTKEEEPRLYRTVENLSIGSGLPMPKVWVIEDGAPNAMATGRNPAGAHVAATRGLLDKLDDNELEAVMAHEMSHVGNYDIRLMATIAVVVGLVALLADVLLRFTWYGTGARSSNRGKGGGGIAIVVMLVALAFIALSPLIASIMRLALSRQREYLADASGALLCRNPEAMASALEKISKDPEPLEVANKATAHMYIENPLKEHTSFLNSLFSTHPPVEERIKILRAMG